MVEGTCTYCHATTTFNVAFSQVFVANDGCNEEFTLASCKACDEVALFYREDPESLWEEDKSQQPVFNRLWPVEPRKIGFVLPSEVAIAYEEAVRAEKHKLWLASSVMIGRCLEAICKIYDPSIRSISEGIKQMREDGVLSEEMYEWSNELRLLRNASAHATQEPVFEGDVGFALDFLKAILEVFFEIRPKFEHFKEGRGRS